MTDLCNTKTPAFGCLPTGSRFHFNNLLLLQHSVSSFKSATRNRESLFITILFIPEPAKLEKYFVIVNPETIFFVSFCILKNNQLKKTAHT